MKIGVIGTRGGWSSEMLADTIQARTGFRLLVDMQEIRADLSNGEIRFGAINLADLDGLIIKKIGSRYSPDLLDRLEILRFLSARGVPILSHPEKIMRVLDRLSCTVTLQIAGIPMPPTTITESAPCALECLREYGEAVFKPLYSSKARGMMLLQNGPEAADAIHRYQADNPIMYIQKKIDLGARDLGIAFLGGEYLTTYARCKNSDAWNTTTASGGRYAPHTPEQSIIDLAQKAQDLFGLDFTCVDVVETADGPMVFEVSAFGGFRGITETCDIDPAARYVEYVMEKIRQ